MTTVIKDLPLNKELDSKEMTATEGGFTIINNAVPVYWLGGLPRLPD